MFCHFLSLSHTHSLPLSSRPLAHSPSRRKTLQYTVTCCHRWTPATADSHAYDCNTLQHSATHSNRGTPVAPDTATHFNTLQHNATHCSIFAAHCKRGAPATADSHVTDCSTRQYTAAHCNTMHHTATEVLLQQLKAMNLTTTHCNTLQHTLSHCNTLQQSHTCNS